MPKPILTSATFAGLSLFLFLVSCLQPAHAQDSPRQRLSLHRSWLFLEGDVPFAEIKGHQASYGNTNPVIDPLTESPIVQVARFSIPVD